MNPEVKIPSVWSDRATKVVLAIVLASIGLAFLPLALTATAGSFRTTDLIVDNTSKFGGKTQWGPVSPGPSQEAWFQEQSPSTTTQFWIQEDDTGHTGTGGNNEAINLALRQNAGFAMGAGGNAVGRNMDIDTVCTKTSGTGTLDCNGIFLASQGGDTNEALFITHGSIFSQASEGMAITAGPVIFSQTLQVSGTGTFDKASGTALSVPNAAFSLAQNGTIGTNSTNTVAMNSTITTDVLMSTSAADQIFRMTNNSVGGHNYGYDNGGTAGFFGATLTLFDNTASKIAWQVDASQNFFIPNGALDMGAHLIHNVVDPVSAQDAATKNYVDSKASTIQSSVYYADGTDGTCAFDCVATPVCGASLVGSTYTLTRDIAPNIMTVAASCTVREDNFRIMIYTSLTGGGAGATISNSGFNAGSPSANNPGNCGGTNSHYFQACATNGASGANGTGAGNNGNANTGAIPQWPAQAAAAPGASGAGHGQGGGGGTSGIQPGGTGGAISNPSVNVGYFTAVGGWSGRYDSYGNQWSLYGSAGGGGAALGGAPADLGGGGGGGGGINFVSANQCLGTISIESKGGNGANGTVQVGIGSGGGGGGGGGVVVLIYSHRSAGCTTSVAGGTHGNGAGTGANGGDGSSGSTLLYNLSGDGT